jgi:predicted house-cleaning noncanonical NTP pyrophosphatase (MazG superfamily)
MDFKKIEARVVAWNSARYDREYNEELTHALLREEYQEWLTSDNNVNDIKELADIAFVCMGVVWKCGLNEQEIAEFSIVANERTGQLLDCKLLPPAYYIGALIDSLAFVQGADPAFICLIIWNLALQQLYTSGLSLDEIHKVLEAVCDSNDSKPVEKVASNVKANASKDERYRPAEPDIARIIGETACVIIH